MFNNFNIAKEVNSAYIPEKQTRLDVAQSMQNKLKTNLQARQNNQMQQPGAMEIPENVQGWGNTGTN